MDQLKDRERRVLEYMKKEISEMGYPPTVREICNSLGIKSTSTVHKDIGNLEKKGYLKRDPSKPRAYVPVDLENDCTGSSSPASHSNESAGQDTRNDITDVPVVGQVAAGTPILAEQNITDSIPIPQRFLGSGNNYLLTVKGESMIEAGIMDGDYVLVEHADSVANGDIVVAMVDGFESEATVKTFYKEKDHIRLQPENHNMSPIIVKDVRIMGKVKGVFRYF